MGAVCITHPLDLLKVHLQTQTKGYGLLRLAKSTVKHNGVRSLYSGLSASLARQATYSTVRFGTYDILKNNFTEEGTVPSFSMKLLYAGVGGVFGAFAGNPCDVVNVRMQDDVRIASHAGRRNYRNIFHGIYQITRTEGGGRLWRGVGANCSRAILMNIGQVAFYDQAKQLLLRHNIINDNMYGHLLSSAMAGTAATVITQPFDVLKTRMMQSNQYKNLLSCGVDTFKEGPQALFKGFVPAWCRLLPQTILTFLILEQLRKAFPLPQKQCYNPVIPIVK